MSSRFPEQSCFGGCLYSSSSATSSALLPKSILVQKLMDTRLPLPLYSLRCGGCRLVEGGRQWYNARSMLELYYHTGCRFVFCILRALNLHLLSVPFKVNEIVFAWFASGAKVIWTALFVPVHGTVVVFSFPLILESATRTKHTAHDAYKEKKRVPTYYSNGMGHTGSQL